MDVPAADGYAELPDRIADVVDKLKSGVQGEQAEDIERLLGLFKTSTGSVSRSSWRWSSSGEARSC